MKIAILSDLHANFVALQAVLEHIENWRPDHVVVAGDFVNRGPRPAESLRMLVEKSASGGWLFIRGNHEDYVIEQSSPQAPVEGPLAAVHRPSRWTANQLGSDIALLVDMPFQQSLWDPNGNELRFVHASMLGNRVGIYPETPDERLPAKLGVGAPLPSHNLAVFGVGHTHRPLIRTKNSTLIVNAGSAGLPFDYDTRVSYAQLTFQDGQWRAAIIRLEYDLAQAEMDFFRFGYLDGGGPLVKLVLTELHDARSMLYGWAVKYQEAAMAGEITVEESVNQYLASLDMV